MVRNPFPVGSDLFQIPALPGLNQDLSTIAAIRILARLFSETETNVGDGRELTAPRQAPKLVLPIMQRPCRKQENE
ncbi:hypothetical protein DTL42_25140 [Bremerella cremea]|uniref:Uncharacterized protein n=1 Tax=Bremerella cremea TaxID=1031537 RepID=A0A368KLZ9_9BACT|nr:hypothetical protein DTL42_25140 [Bremerella cremea]